jgi:transposase, IS30 family
MKNKSKINASERDQIGVWLAEKVSLREIARRLKRSVSSISDEVKRNSHKSVYHPHQAQLLSEERNRKSRRLNPLKNDRIYAYVISKLRSGWSPEQIAGRLKKINNGKTIICQETIYRHIYSDEGKEKQLSQYLVRAHPRRRKWHGRYVYHRGIANRTSIRLRPEEVNNNSIFGHWETDVVEGSRHTGGIQTMLERKTRFFKGQLISKIDSEYGIWAQKKLITKYPPQARRSVTMDNGKENYNHSDFHPLGTKTYFCDPYCSWQKGSNENHNGILRRYIPKKTDFTQITQPELSAIIQEINNRPRKCLGYETSFEAFQRELKLTSRKEQCSDSD